eukprot:366546-Chlamydomonas_euryale.AAC.52
MEERGVSPATWLCIACKAPMFPNVQFDPKRAGWTCGREDRTDAMRRMKQDGAGTWTRRDGRLDHREEFQP